MQQETLCIPWRQEWSAISFSSGFLWAFIYTLQFNVGGHRWRQQWFLYLQLNKEINRIKGNSIHKVPPLQSIYISPLLYLYTYKVWEVFTLVFISKCSHFFDISSDLFTQTWKSHKTESSFINFITSLPIHELISKNESLLSFLDEVSLFISCCSTSDCKEYI